MVLKRLAEFQYTLSVDPKNFLRSIRELKSFLVWFNWVFPLSWLGNVFINYLYKYIYYTYITPDENRQITHHYLRIYLYIQSGAESRVRVVQIYQPFPHIYTLYWHQRAWYYGRMAVYRTPPANINNILIRAPLIRITSYVTQYVVQRSCYAIYIAYTTSYCINTNLRSIL